MKKVRAILQLMAGGRSGDGDLKILRRAGRLLSPLRDADAMLGTAKDLCGRRHVRGAREICSTIRHTLNRQKKRLTRGARHDRVEKRVADALKKVQRSVDKWPERDAEVPPLAAAVKRIYKAARKGMGPARSRSRSVDVHQWRKRVKTLWYALRLLEARAPWLRTRLTRLRRLETWLGEDHNLLLLRTEVVANRHLPHAARARLRVISVRRQAELRKKAFAIGAQVFRTPPKKLLRGFRDL
jgi:hypothetical protein